MHTIKFSHQYKKMPKHIGITKVHDVAVVEYADLTPEQIEEDTAIVGGGNYELPQGRLIWITLESTQFPNIPARWGTMRSFTEKKYQYYRSLIGRGVRIEIIKSKDV